MMNGTLTVGTREQSGDPNGQKKPARRIYFLFGVTAVHVHAIRSLYYPHWHYEHQARDPQSNRPYDRRMYSPAASRAFWARFG